MKSLFIFIVAVFCFTTIKSQTEMDWFPVLYTIDVSDDSIDSITKTDSVANSIKTKEKSVSNPEYSMFGLRRTYKEKTGLAWEIYLCYIILFLLGLKINKLRKKNKEEIVDGGAVCIGLIIMSTITSLFLLLLWYVSAISIIGFVLLLVSLTCMYFIGWGSLNGLWLLILSGMSVAYLLWGLVNSQWILILVGISVFGFGLLCRYLYIREAKE